LRPSHGHTTGIARVVDDERAAQALDTRARGGKDASFKLHAPYQTTVEGRVENGKVVDLKVTPESRIKDIINAEKINPQ
jgi:hypothetical protein